MTARVQYRLVAATDIGLVRECNEDSLCLGSLDAGEPLPITEGNVLEHELASSERGPLVIVCDGMGGVRGGDVASRVACDTIWTEMRASSGPREREVVARHLRRAVRAANTKIIAEADKSPEHRGMGTTVSAVVFAADTVIVAQVGDSRAYVLRRGVLTQITRDQSVVSALVQAGRLTESQARYSMQRGLILQALGSAPDVEVSLSVADLRRGDRVLVCSDGLHGLVPNEVIRYALTLDAPPREQVRKLLELARSAGGSDNVTVAVIDVETEELDEPASQDDQPAFTELDPALEGEDALLQTSMVARRLAHRAGIRRTAEELPVPATGQHRVVESPDISGRIGLWPWLVALAVVLASLGYALGLWP